MSTADAYFDRHGYDVDRGDDAEARAELAGDYDALFAIDELRTAYRAAVEAQEKYLSPKAQKMLREYLDLDDASYHDSSLQGHLQAAVEADI